MVNEDFNIDQENSVVRKPYTFNINWHFQKNLPSYSKIDSQKIYKISRKETMGFCKYLFRKFHYDNI